MRCVNCGEWDEDTTRYSPMFNRALCLKCWCLLGGIDLVCREDRRVMAEQDREEEESGSQ